MPELILPIVIALLVAFLIVLVIRTLLFVPKGAPREHPEPVFVNSEEAADTLAEMIRC